MTNSAAPVRLPRQVTLLGAVSLLNDFASEMIYPLLPAFVTGVLGAGPQALGALDGAAEFAAAAVKLGAGRLADRRRLRGTLIVWGYLAAVVVRPAIALTGAAWQVIALRVTDRLGKGLRTPPRDALIADVTPPPAWGRAFGLQRGLDHAGAVLGPLAAWWLLALRAADLRGVIAASLVPGVAVLALAIWAVRGAPRGAGGAGAAPPPAPAAPAAAAARGDRAVLARAHARYARHPAHAATGRPGGGRAAAVGGGARGALGVELCRRSGERPAGAGAHDVARVGGVRGARRRDGAGGERRRGLGGVPRARARGRAHRESGTRAHRPACGRASGERVRPVSRRHGRRRARGRARPGRRVPGRRGAAGVPGERRARRRPRGGERRHLPAPRRRQRPMRRPAPHTRAAVSSSGPGPWRPGPAPGTRVR